MRNTHNLIAAIWWKILVQFISEVECTHQQRLILNSQLIKEKLNHLKIKRLCCQRITSWDYAKNIPINFSKLPIISCLHLISLKKVTLWIMKSSNNWHKHTSCNKGTVRLSFTMKNSLTSMKESNFPKDKFIKKWPKSIKNKETLMIKTGSWNWHSANIVNLIIKENSQSLLL